MDAELGTDDDERIEGASASRSGHPRGRPKLTEGDKHIPAHEIQVLLAVAREAVEEERRAKRRRSRRAERDYLVIVLGLNAGLRAHELAGLAVGDLRLDADPPRVVVRGGKARKAGRARRSADLDEVVLPFDVAELLRAWIRGRQADEPLFCSDRTGAGGRKLPLTRGGIWKAVKKALRRAGLNDKYNVHALRHRFVMAEVEAMERRGEIDPYLLARRARHRSLEPTMNYVQQRRSKLQEHMRERSSET